MFMKFIHKIFELNNTFKRIFIQVFHCDKEDRKSKERITQEFEEILDQMPQFSPEFVIRCDHLKGKLDEFLGYLYEMPKLPEELNEGIEESKSKIIMEKMDKMQFNVALYGNNIMNFIVETYPDANYDFSHYDELPTYESLKCKCGIEVYKNSWNLGSPFSFLENLMDSHKS